MVLDFFAGSGTTGAACLELGRRFILVDENPEALEVMARRFLGVSDIEWVNFDPKPFQKNPIQLSFLDSENEGGNLEGL
jgi:site-specific DNA-methyltransferase (adenine-specific)